MWRNRVSEILGLLGVGEKSGWWQFNPAWVSRILDLFLKPDQINAELTSKLQIIFN
jgi:hypothetical protein